VLEHGRDAVGVLVRKGIQPFVQPKLLRTSVPVRHLGAAAARNRRLPIERVRGPFGRIANRPLPAVELAKDPRALAPRPIEVTARLEFVELGSISLDEAGRPAFPIVPDEPGLYRITLVPAEENPLVYFGESSGLAARMRGYRNPGPTQQTNKRLNAEIRSVLTKGGSASLAVALEATIAVAGRRYVAELHSQFSRRLLENAGLTAAQVTGERPLNAGAVAAKAPVRN
jgi:hypothetical protein